MNFYQKTCNVLREHNISLCEHFVMCTVGYRIPLPPQQLAKRSASLSEGDSRGEFTTREHLTAIKHCTKKGLLEILTDGWERQEANRLESSQLPELLDLDFQSGVVDFTQKGYLLHRQIIGKIFGKKRIQQGDSGWNIDEDQFEINFYSETKRLCVKLVDAFHKNPDIYTGAPTKILSSQPPHIIGAWKPNRFIELKSGYHAKLTYQIAEYK